MNCLRKCSKYILFLINLLFLILACALISFGLMIVLRFGYLDKLLGSGPKTLPIFIITFGSFIFFLSFLGCCGIIKDDKCILVTYSIIVLILLTVQVILIVYIMRDKQKFSNLLKAGVDEAWELQKYPTDDATVMNMLQFNFKCCGKTGPEDYKNKVPSSCCGETTKTCTTKRRAKTGCENAIDVYFRQKFNIIVYVLLAVCVLELVVLILGCCVSGEQEEATFILDHASPHSPVYVI